MAKKNKKSTGVGSIEIETEESGFVWTPKGGLNSLASVLACTGNLPEKEEVVHRITIILRGAVRKIEEEMKALDRDAKYLMHAANGTHTTAPKYIPVIESPENN